jgi:hypothetical protein
MENCRISIGDKIIIENIPENLPIAKSIIIKPLFSSLPEIQFQLLELILSQQLGNSYLYLFLKSKVGVLWFVITFLLFQYMEKPYKFQIKKIIFANECDFLYQACNIDPSTHFFLEGENSESISDSNELSYSSIGGHSKQLDYIKELVELALHKPQLFSCFGE